MTSKATPNKNRCGQYETNTTKISKTNQKLKMTNWNQGYREGKQNPLLSALV